MIELPLFCRGGSLQAVTARRATALEPVSVAKGHITRDEE
jgi:hypothetical protein